MANNIGLRRFRTRPRRSPDRVVKLRLTLSLA
jgi:hypothetical protein